MKLYYLFLYRSLHTLTKTLTGSLQDHFFQSREVYIISRRDTARLPSCDKRATLMNAWQPFFALYRKSLV
jgi:hypothetical protein